jgi:hypothetical protein
MRGQPCSDANQPIMKIETKPSSSLRIIAQELSIEHGQRAVVNEELKKPQLNSMIGFVLSDK